MARTFFHRYRRQRGCATGRRIEFSCLAGELRIRSLGRWGNVPFQRPTIHDYRHRSAGFLWSEDRQCGYARFLAALDDGAANRRPDLAFEESPPSLARFDRARSPRYKSENSRGAASGGTAPTAGEPCAGYDFSGKDALGEANGAPDTWRCGRFVDARRL